MPDDIDRLIADLARQRQQIQKHIEELDASTRVTESIVGAVENLRNRRAAVNATGDETMRRIASRNEGPKK